MAIVSAIPGFLTLAETATLIGVSHAQVTRYIHNDLLKAVAIGNQYLVREEDAESFERPPRGNPDFQRQKRRKKKSA